MPRPKTDAKREHRITMDIVVDAYNEEERALAWYYYLEEQLTFPFRARVRRVMAASPLRIDDDVSVIGLAHEDLCRVGIFVWVRQNRSKAVAPLAQLVPISADDNTQVAVGDWHYWHDHRYTF
jgi:Calcium binding